MCVDFRSAHNFFGKGFGCALQLIFDFQPGALPVLTFFRQRHQAFQFRAVLGLRLVHENIVAGLAQFLDVGFILYHKALKKEGAFQPRSIQLGYIHAERDLFYVDLDFQRMQPD